MFSPESKSDSGTNAPAFRALSFALGVWTLPIEENPSPAAAEDCGETLSTNSTSVPTRLNISTRLISIFPFSGSSAGHIPNVLCASHGKMDLFITKTEHCNTDD